MILLHFQSIYGHWHAFQPMRWYYGGVFRGMIQAPGNGMLLAVQKEFGISLKQILLKGSSHPVQLIFFDLGGIFGGMVAVESFN